MLAIRIRVSLLGKVIALSPASSGARAPTFEYPGHGPHQIHLRMARAIHRLRRTSVLSSALGVALVFAVGQGCQRRSPEGGETVARGALPLTVSSSFPLDARALGLQKDTRIIAGASGGGIHLLVLSAVEGDLETGARRLMAVRVATDGTILDPVGIDLGADLDGTEAGAVYSGSGFVVVSRAGSSFVDDDGDATAPTPLGFVPSAIVWGGDRALAVSAVGSARFLDAAGAPLGDPFVLPGGNDLLMGGDAAFDGTHYLVQLFSSSTTTVSLASVSNTGPTGHTASVASAGSNPYGAGTGGIASNGSGVFLLDYVAPPASRYYRFASVAAGGEISLQSAVVRSTNLVSPTLSAKYVYFIEGRFVHTVWPALVSSSATTLVPLVPEPIVPLDTAFRALLESPPPIRFGTAIDGDDPIAFTGAFATRVDLNLARLDDPLLLPLAQPLPQSPVASAFDGTNYVASWVDLGRDEVRSARVSPSGVVLDVPARTVATGPFRTVGSVGMNGGSLVVTGNSESVDLAAVALDTLGNGTPVNLGSLGTNYYFDGTLATDGTHYLVGVDFFQRAALISPAGQVTLVNAALPYHGARVAVVFDGQSYVAVWNDIATNGDGEVNVARLGADLDPIDSSGVPLIHVTDLSYSGSAIGTNGSASLVVWSSFNGSEHEIRCGRLTHELDFDDSPGALVATSSAGYGLNVQFDGDNYWILWRDGLGGGSLKGRRVSPNLEFVDAVPFTIAGDVAASSLVQTGRASATVGAGKVFAAYARGDLGGEARGVIASEEAGGAGGAAGGGGGGGAGVGGAGVGGAGGGGAGGGGASDGGAGVGGAGDGGTSGTAGNGGSGAAGGLGGTSSGGGAGNGAGGASGASGASGAGDAGGMSAAGGVSAAGAAGGMSATGGMSAAGGVSGAGDAGGMSAAGGASGGSPSTPDAGEGGAADDPAGGASGEGAGAAAGESSGGGEPGSAGQGDGAGEGGDAGRDGAGGGSAGNPSDPGGCSCRVPGGRRSEGSFGLLALLGVLGLRRRVTSTYR